MVLGKCSGEQRLEQVRGQLLWSALTGCGFANTWTECLRPDSARLQKCALSDLKAACDLQRKPGVLIDLAASVQVDDGALHRHDARRCGVCRRRGRCRGIRPALSWLS